MPKSIKFAALWTVSVVAALALSWAAVSQVRNRVIQPVTVIPTTIAAVDVDSTRPTLVVAVPETAPESLDPSLSTSTTSPAATTSSTSPDAPATTRAPSAAPSTTPTTTSTTAPPPQTTTTVTASSLVRSSYSLPGGSVTIESAPGEVYFASAIPQPGFTVELREVGPARVRVRFTSATTVSEFEAKWDDGNLDIETSEHTP